MDTDGGGKTCCIPLEQHSGCPFQMSVPLNTVQVCTYARRRTIHTLQTKSNIYSSKLRTAFRRKNTNKLRKLRHREARRSLIIIYLLVCNVCSWTWNVHYSVPLQKVLESLQRRPVQSVMLTAAAPDCGTPFEIFWPYRNNDKWIKTDSQIHSL